MGSVGWVRMWGCSMVRKGVSRAEGAQQRAAEKCWGQRCEG